MGKRAAGTRSIVWDPHGDCLTEEKRQCVRTGPPFQHLIVQLPTRNCHGYVDCVKELAESTRALAELWENTYLAAIGVSPDALPRLRIPPFELGSSGRSRRLIGLPMDVAGGQPNDGRPRNSETVSVGDPERIVSDRGTAFTANSFAEYVKIEHIVNTTGVPRGNGQAERVNRTVLSMLAKLSSGQSSKWYKSVGAVQRALNSYVHASTRQTPLL